MFSLNHPEVMTQLAECGAGLWPLKASEGPPSLVIKGSNDLAFAAKIRRSLTFHLYGLIVGEARAVGIITAIYDRPTSPIVIQTVCSDELMRRGIQEILARDKLSIYFFDTHNSELFGGDWSVTQSDKVRELFDAHASNLERSVLLEFYVALKQRFANPNDNGLSIQASLLKASQPENLSVIHVTEESTHSRRGEGHGIYHSTLETTENPGELHEAEIARHLARVYERQQVIVNPEISEGVEFCDVLAIGKHEAIAIHAKSTMRDESRFYEDGTRRDSRLDKHFRKAVAQVKGAERAFYQLRRPVKFCGKELPITPETTLLIHVIVLHEKSPGLFKAWAQQLSGIASKRVPVAVLDTAELLNMLDLYRSRESFLSALWTLVDNFERDKTIGEYTFGKERLARH